jgi:ANTAR domain/GAF domain
VTGADVSVSAPRRLPDVFAELIGAIVDGRRSSLVLELITRRSVELFQVASVGILVADPRGGHRVVAASDERADLAELFQSFEEEGPALDVLATRRALTVDLAAADERWPGFAPAAREAGVGWVHAHPIHLDSSVVGALNLFRARPDGGAPDPALSQAVCGLASIVPAQERPDRRGERLAEHIQQILHERARIEQVKGMLAAHLDVSPGDAHAALSHHARAHGVTTVQVAGDVIEGRTDPRAVADEWRRSAAPADDAT